jgi:hypothetical protein
VPGSIIGRSRTRSYYEEFAAQVLAGTNRQPTALRLGQGPGSGVRSGRSDSRRMRIAFALDLAMLVVSGG